MQEVTNIYSSCFSSSLFTAPGFKLAQELGKLYFMKTTTCVLLLVLSLFAAAATLAQSFPPDNYPISSFDPELQNEEQIWICPTDSTAVIAVWRDFRLGYRQVGIGREFVPGFWLDSLISPSMQIFSWQSDPTLTADRDGNFYMSVLDYQPGNHDDSSHISFLKSTDKGITWTGPVTVVDTAYVFHEAMEDGRVLRSAVIVNVMGQYQSITCAVTIHVTGVVERVEIMVYRESRGGEVRRSAFLKQFEKKTVNDRLLLGRDVKGISGATISSRAVAEGVRLALHLHQTLHSGD